MIVENQCLIPFLLVTIRKVVLPFIMAICKKSKKGEFEDQDTTKDCLRWNFRFGPVSIVVVIIGVCFIVTLIVQLSMGRKTRIQ